MSKGILVSIGGAEDKGTDLEAGIIDRNRLNFFELGILKNFISLIEKSEPRIEVITTASTIPDEVGENYLDAFTKLNCNNIGHMRIRKREETSTEEMMQRLNAADAIMFSGGNQLKLTSIFGGTDFLKRLIDRFENEEKFVIAGTSAGAMAMSNTMIYEGNASKAHLKGEVKLTTGLAFVKDVIIDSHFDKRGRFARLAQAVAANPQALGIGLGEDTGVIIRNDDSLEIIGSGAVILVDGHNIKHNNIAEISDGNPISVENLKVHILERGNHFHLTTKKFEANVNEMI
jgi:cyanophycinase